MRETMGLPCLEAGKECVAAVSIRNLFFFFQAEDGIRDLTVTGVQTCALPISVKVNIGDSKYPADGASGGSTTVGGVSSSTRRAATAALNQLLEKVAPSLSEIGRASCRERV